MSTASRQARSACKVKRAKANSVLLAHMHAHTKQRTQVDIQQQTHAHTTNAHIWTYCNRHKLAWHTCSKPIPPLTLNMLATSFPFLSTDAATNLSTLPGRQLTHSRRSPMMVLLKGQESYDGTPLSTRPYDGLGDGLGPYDGNPPRFSKVQTFAILSL